MPLNILGPQLHTTLMLSHKNNTTECQQESEPKLQSEPKPQPKPYHSVTRAKNATQCPGAEAEKVLWVCRDLAVIQGEKDAKKRKKEEKKHVQQKEATCNKAAACFVEENCTQQKVTMAKEEASMPHCRSQGMSYF